MTTTMMKEPLELTGQKLMLFFPYLNRGKTFGPTRDKSKSYDGFKPKIQDEEKYVDRDMTFKSTKEL